MNTPECPMCQAVEWMPRKDEWLEYSICSECGSEIVLPGQQKKNEEALKAGKT